VEPAGVRADGTEGVDSGTAVRVVGEIAGACASSSAARPAAGADVSLLSACGGPASRAVPTPGVGPSEAGLGRSLSTTGEGGRGSVRFFLVV
jgi:hypothetical protein